MNLKDIMRPLFLRAIIEKKGEKSGANKLK